VDIHPSARRHGIAVIAEDRDNLQQCRVARRPKIELAIHAMHAAEVPEAAARGLR
jgi:hypothetical protein